MIPGKTLIQPGLQFLEFISDEELHIGIHLFFRSPKFGFFCDSGHVIHFINSFFVSLLVLDQLTISKGIKLISKFKRKKYLIVVILLIL